MLEELSATKKILIALLISGILIILFVIMIYANKGPDETSKVVRTDSGLEYVITKPSDSSKVAAKGDVVNFYYTGKIKDGEQFDTNVGKTPVRIMLGQGRMIAGVEEALVGMHEGEKRTVTIPPDLGYGDKDQGVIPPNSTLVFELEISEIEEK